MSNLLDRPEFKQEGLPLSKGLTSREPFQSVDSQKPVADRYDTETTPVDPLVEARATLERISSLSEFDHDLAKQRLERILQGEAAPDEAEIARLKQLLSEQDIQAAVAQYLNQSLTAEIDQFLGQESEKVGVVQKAFKWAFGNERLSFAKNWKDRSFGRIANDSWFAKSWMNQGDTFGVATLNGLIGAAERFYNSFKNKTGVRTLIGAGLVGVGTIAVFQGLFPVAGWAFGARAAMAGAGGYLASEASMATKDINAKTTTERKLSLKDRLIGLVNPGHLAKSAAELEEKLAHESASAYLMSGIVQDLGGAMAKRETLQHSAVFETIVKDVANVRSADFLALIQPQLDELNAVQQSIGLEQPIPSESDQKRIDEIMTHLAELLTAHKQSIQRAAQSQFEANQAGGKKASLARHTMAGLIGTASALVSANLSVDRLTGYYRTMVDTFIGTKIVQTEETIGDVLKSMSSSAHGAPIHMEQQVAKLPEYIQGGEQVDGTLPIPEPAVPTAMPDAPITIRSHSATPSFDSRGNLTGLTLENGVARPDLIPYITTDPQSGQLVFDEALFNDDYASGKWSALKRSLGVQTEAQYTYHDGTHHTTESDQINRAIDADRVAPHTYVNAAAYHANQVIDAAQVAPGTYVLHGGGGGSAGGGHAFGGGGGMFSATDGFLTPANPAVMAGENPAGIMSNHVGVASSDAGHLTLSMDDGEQTATKDAMFYGAEQAKDLTTKQLSTITKTMATSDQFARSLGYSSNAEHTLAQLRALHETGETVDVTSVRTMNDGTKWFEAKVGNDTIKIQLDSDGKVADGSAQFRTSPTSLQYNERGTIVIPKTPMPAENSVKVIQIPKAGTPEFEYMTRPSTSGGTPPPSWIKTVPGTLRVEPVTPAPVTPHASPLTPHPMDTPKPTATPINVEPPVAKPGPMPTPEHAAPESPSQQPVQPKPVTPEQPSQPNIPSFEEEPQTAAPAAFPETDVEPTTTPLSFPEENTEPIPATFPNE